MNHITTWIAGALVCALAASLSADSLVTVSGKRVEGQIVSETDRDVTIHTDNYGDLKFRKIDLKELNKSGSAPADSTGFGNTGATGGNPFGGTGGNPFAPTGGGNPFGPKPIPNATTGDDGSVAIPIAAATPEALIEQRKAVMAPTVPFSWDAVVFSIPENQTVNVIPQPGGAAEDVMVDTTIRNGAEIKTGPAGVRVVFKNGADIMRVSPHSQVTITESLPTQERVEVRRGSAWFEIGKAGGKTPITVGTSNAELSSTNGVFRVADALDHGFHVASLEGTVLVRSSKSQAYSNVSAGQMLLVRPDGSMTEPQDITEAVRKEDGQWDSLDANWWFQSSRTDLPGHVDEQQNLVSMNDLQGYLRKIADGFLRYAEDTGHIPTTEEAFSVLRQNTNSAPGWKGPYFKGIMPPLDSWGRPIRYVTRQTGQGGHTVGIVYSTGDDNADNNGDPSADVAEMVLYYQLENLPAGQAAIRR